MKRYTIPFGRTIGYVHPAPDRTASKSAGGIFDFDVTFQVWPNRKAMARTIRMQQQREHQRGDWRALVPLSDGEGY